MKKIIMFATLVYAWYIFSNYSYIHDRTPFSLPLVDITTSNVLLGYQTGDTISSSANVLIGSWAGQHLKTSAYHTIVGAYSGLGYKDNFKNTTIATYYGYSAAEYLDSAANYNVAVGAYTLQNYSSKDSLKDALGNTALGHKAGQFIHSGDYNVFLGYNSGQYVKDGVNNIYLGQATQLYNKHGKRNVVLGNAPGNTAYQADSNVIVGHSAGLYSVGNGNVYIGASAFKSSAISSYKPCHNNIIIGKNAAPDLGNESNYNIYIGPNSDLAGSTTTLDSGIVIGTGTSGVSGTGPIIYGDMCTVKKYNSTKHRYLMVDAYLYCRPTGASFKRAVTYTPPAIDTWYRVKIPSVANWANNYDTQHFTIADSVLVVQRGGMVEVSVAYIRQAITTDRMTSYAKLVRKRGTVEVDIVGSFDICTNTATGTNEKETRTVRGIIDAAANDTILFKYKTSDTDCIIGATTVAEVGVIQSVCVDVKYLK